MNIFNLLLLIVLIIFMVRRNNRQKNALRKDAKYVETYTGVLKKSETAGEQLDSYYETETEPSLKNKTAVVKIFNDLNNDKDVNEIVENLDIKSIVCLGDKVNLENITENSDVFIWLNLLLTKAKSKENYDVIKKVYEKVSQFDEDLKNNVEYNVFKTTYNCMVDSNETSYEFLRDLLEGNYAHYTYDKQLIGVYKKIAVALLAYKGQEIKEEDKVLLEEFATGQIGNFFLGDLNILDRFNKNAA